jgi:acetyltransferase
LPLPADLRAAIDAELPPRWSRNNPVDCAGGETRDTIPDVMRVIASHPDVHAVVYLGLGIQSNQARMMRDGPFIRGDHGLDRIVAYHERQDARFAEAAAELSRATGKPILTATELAVADPANAGPAAVRASGRLCYASAHRAVTALGHLYRDARHRARRRP